MEDLVKLPTEIMSSQPAENANEFNTKAVGIRVRCDGCDKWRSLPYVFEHHDLPEKWYCHMNKDKSQADCSVPEIPLSLREEDDLIHSEFSRGSVVWAKQAMWPWWPAMVDECPDTEQFYWLNDYSDIPTWYNVTFFDTQEVTRAWIPSNKIKPYLQHKSKIVEVLHQDKKNKKFMARVKKAMQQADDATKCSPEERLEKYTFLARYKGVYVKPNDSTDSF